VSEPFVSTSASQLRRGQTTVVAGLSPATAVVSADHGLGHELRRNVSPARAWSEHDETLHEHLLAGVSRTFALTIPQLPGALRQAVGNAYLLCRIADTIEDDAALDAAMKRAFQGSFLAALRTGRGARAFSDSLHRLLSDSTPAAERELVRSAPRVVACSRQLGSVQRRSITRCVAVMSRGMVQFDHASDRQGLPDREALDRYCYAVAGVVGEMLTDLFCDHAADIEHQRAQLEQRAIRFGRGLQLTNILKDIWEDLEQGRCWLPRDLFDGVGYDLDRLAVGHPGGNPAGFAAGMHRLVAVAHADLREAMRYTLAIPARHAGVRRFLAWAVLLAAATLRNIHARPLFSECAEVKVTRRSVASMMAASRAVIRSRAGLTALFRLAARGLPVPTEPRWSGKAVVRPALSSG
jgi:farnesyl-diphosphate farnesyltransferase